MRSGAPVDVVASGLAAGPVAARNAPGIADSNTGRASDTPTPRRNCRRLRA